MDVLNFFFLILAFVVFTVSALLIRNDPGNQNPVATIAFCVSMAILMCVQW